MKTPYGAWRATYTHGRWVVLSGPASMVILQPAPATATQLVNRLWDQLLNSANITEISATLTGFGLDSMPDLAVFFWDDEQLHCLLRGQVRVLDADSGELLATGLGARTWYESALQVRRAYLPLDEIDPGELLQLPLVVGAAEASAVFLDASAQSTPQPHAAADISEPAGELAEPAPVKDAAQLWAAGPVAAELVAPDPVISEPMFSEPVAVESAGAEPVAAEVLAAEAAIALPVATEALAAEPVAVAEVSAAPPTPDEPDSAVADELAGVPAPDDAELLIPGLTTADEAAADFVPSAAEPDFPSTNGFASPAVEPVVEPENNIDQPVVPTTDSPFAALAAPLAPVPPTPPLSTAAPASPRASVPPVSPLSPVAPVEPTQVLGERPPYAPGQEPGQTDPGVPGLAAPDLPQPGLAQPAGLSGQVIGQAGTAGPWGAHGFAASVVQPVAPAPAMTTASPVVDPQLALSGHDGLTDQFMAPVVLVTPTGEELPLTRPVLVGRAPAPSDQDRDVELVRVASPKHDISRNHVRIAPSQGTIEVTDLYSTNGTIVIPVDGEPLRLEAGASIELAVGGRIDLGDGQILTLRGAE